MFIIKSMLPDSFKKLKIIIPTVEPKIPPIKRKIPISKSMFLFRPCAIAPDTEEPRICTDSVPTAVEGGIPININNGVIKKPPPTPNNPDINPTTKPKNKITNKFIWISAIGK